MKRFAIRWSQWLPSGNDKLEKGTEVWCSGDVSLMAETKEAAERTFSRAMRHFNSIRIISCEEWSPEYKCGDFNQARAFVPDV